MKTQLLSRFLKYLSFETTSNPNSGTTPSSSGQLTFAQHLAQELQQIGAIDIVLDANGYLMATIPSNTHRNCPTIGLIAHLDTSPDFTAANIKPIITENYCGGAITLNKEKNILLSPDLSPELENYIGQTIISTDGTTLLGADDKAGIAEIITAMQHIIANPEIEHGKIRICFTPDEEIGEGADHFDVAKFGANFAYTIDGGEIGELEYENFYAAGAKITITGLNIHPGYGYNKMINAQLIAHKFMSMLPNETPSNTRGYEGFYHLTLSKGDVEMFELNYIIRDFDEPSFENRKNLISNIAATINKQENQPLITVDIHDQYKNMRQMVEPVMYIVDRAKEAMLTCNVEPKIKPIRGGTDGARLSYMSLPCPNIFAGGHNFHGRFEYIPLQSMVKAVEVIVEIVRAR